MPIVKLGRRHLTALGTVDRPTTFYDSDLKGFGLRLMPPSDRNPKGNRSWLVEYRPGVGGRGVAKKRVVLGSPQTLTPEEAREAAKTILASVRLGADPAADRDGQRTAKTLGELAPIYAAQTNPLRKPRTVELYTGYWNNHVLPALGSSIARTIDKNDVLALHRKLGVDHRVTANRIVTLLAHFFEWAADAGYVPVGHNPAKTVGKFRESGRERYLTPEEFGRLGTAIRLAETEGVEWVATDRTKPNAKHVTARPEVRRTVIDKRAAAAIRLLLLTGARLREILNLKWEFVHLDKGLLLLPDSKTGKKAVVLGIPALTILQDLHRASVQEAKAASGRSTKPLSEWVFYSGEDLDRPKADLKRPWRLVTRAAALPGLRAHDLRHSFASVGAGSGLGLPIIGKLLGHTDPATTAKYAHLDADPLRRATDAISAAIDSALKAEAGGVA